MTDIATRYMRLVEKRPELKAISGGRVVGRWPKATGKSDPFWADEWAETYEGQFVCWCEERFAHALILAKLVEKLRSPYFLQPEPDDAGWSVYYYEGNVPTPYSKAYEKPTPLEALLAFWEAQP